jgi:hypothetical protein
MFTLPNNENIVKTYECEKGPSCCGEKIITALTNNRALVRHQYANCCCKPTNVDTAIFLRDVEVVKDSQPPRPPGLIICLPIHLLCILLQGCCGACCDRPRSINVRGGFGTETLTFKNSEVADAANDISSLIQSLKDRK